MSDLHLGYSFPSPGNGTVAGYDHLTANLVHLYWLCLAMSALCPRMASSSFCDANCSNMGRFPTLCAIMNSITVIMCGLIDISGRRNGPNERIC